MPRDIKVDCYYLDILFGNGCINCLFKCVKSPSKITEDEIVNAINKCLEENAIDIFYVKSFRVFKKTIDVVCDYDSDSNEGDK